MHSVDVGTRRLMTSSDGTSLPFAKSYTRRTASPVADTVTLTALNAMRTEEITVRVRNGMPLATGGSVTVAGVEVLGALDFPLTEKVVKVNIGSTRPVQVISRITGTPGGTYSVIVEAGTPVSPAGGTVEVAGGDVRIAVPAGAVSGELAIAAEPIETSDDPGNFGAFDFGPDGTTFEKPITLTFPVPVAALPAGGTPGLYWRQDENDEWRPLDNPKFDAVAGTVSGDISHFTQIGIRTRTIAVCPTGTATRTVAEAVAQVARQGQVILCDAEHAVDGVTVDKPMTITSAAGALARVTSTMPNTFTVDGISNGLVRFSRLAFSVAAASGVGVNAKGTYDQVVIDSSTFEVATPEGSLTAGVLATASTVNGASLRAIGNTIVGGWSGIRTIGVPLVDIRDNRIDLANQANIDVQGGGAVLTSGTIVGNRIDNCGTSACIRVATASGIRVDSNSITAVRRSFVGTTTIGSVNAISVTGSSAGIRGNSIVGQNLPENLNSIFAFPFNDAAIGITGATSATSVTVLENSVEGSGRGIGTSWPTTAGALEPAVNGRDNRLNKIGIAFIALGGSRMTMRYNDVTNAVLPLVNSGTSTPARAAGLLPGDMLCNYWGAPTFVGQLNGAGVAINVFLPASSAPVAGSSGSGCTPTPVPLASATRYCTTTDVAAVIPEFSSILWAIASTADGGTVTICPGTHRLVGVSLTRPMTIQGDPTGPRPILDAGANETGTTGNGASFAIGLTQPGLITIRNLEFVRARFQNIWISGTHDRVLIENNLFRPMINSSSTTVLSGATVGYWAGVTMGNSTRPVTGNGVTVRNNDFVGGDIGVHVYGNTNALVEGNRFSGQRNAGFHGGDGTASNNRVVGNTFSDCGRVWCLGVFQDKQPLVKDNVFNVAYKPGRTNNIIQINGDSVVVTGNSLLGSGGAQITDDSESWPASVAMNVRGRIALVTNNRIEAVQGAVFTSSGRLVFTDNTIDRARQLFALNTTDVSISRNDFTNYISPVFLTGLTATAGSFSCNWWGGVTGPNTATGFTASAFSPFATAPIAGTNATCQ